MGDFAKLYHAEDVGQVLVLIDSGENGPEVRISFKPDGLGICTIKLNFKDTDEGWDKAEKAFKQIDEKGAILAVKEAVKIGPF